MSKITSLEIREFSHAITSFVTASPILWEVKRMALENILQQADVSAAEELKREIAERDSLEKKKAEVVPVQPKEEPVGPAEDGEVYEDAENLQQN